MIDGSDPKCLNSVGVPKPNGNMNDPNTNSVIDLEDLVNIPVSSEPPVGFHDSNDDEQVVFNPLNLPNPFQPRRSQRSNIGRGPNWYQSQNFSRLLLSSGKIKISDPKTVKQATSGQYSEQWKDAMNREYDSLIKNGTWILVDPPKNKNIVDCKWVFKTKFEYF